MRAWRRPAAIVAVPPSGRSGRRAPTQRAGIGQIFLNDVDDAIEDARWIAEAGLRGGVLLPKRGLPLILVVGPLMAAGTACIGLTAKYWAVAGMLAAAEVPHERQAALWALAQLQDPEAVALLKGAPN